MSNVFLLPTFQTHLYPKLIQLTLIMVASQMSITEILPQVESLPHADKFRLIQFLISKLAREEGISLEPRKKALSQHESLSPKPIGRVYYSGRTDISMRAKDLLFEEKLQAIRQRSKDVDC
ncbi:hypothetical protein BGP_1939 [Beggiatoa sp. PS]|nr:hypothetical protein BGP_1939 [Beggiatoa sp. PS]